jgi:VWFA-related protein
MHRSALFPFVVCLLAAAAGSSVPLAQEDPDEPIPSDTRETVQVNLVLIDALVLDRQGRTVPGLTRDDFMLSVQGKAVEIDVVDSSCPGGVMEDPGNIRRDGTRRSPAPEIARRMVLLFDYYHLDHIHRGEALRAAQWLVKNVKAPEDEVMVAALANGMHIEQRFTTDAEKLHETLVRMEYDRSMWAREFGSVTDRPFFDNLATLMDVLAQYDGPKATVMFSMLGAYRDHWDLWYGDVVQRAAVGRTVLYPVWGGGLVIGGPAGGSAALARLANETGGRLTRNTNDLTLGYARAQRDLACRYTLGFYVDSSKTRYPMRIRVGVKQSGLEVRQPEEIRFWSEEERRNSRVRAAFADPQLHEDPLVRAAVFPVRPRSENDWDTLMVAHFQQHLGPEGAEREFAVSLAREKLHLWSGNDRLEIEPPADGIPGVRPVTIYGEAPLKPGMHTLTVVLTDPGGGNLETTQVDVDVPRIPFNELFVRGPVLARVAGGGVLIHAGDKKDTPEPTALEELIGEGNTLEPLLVNTVESDDRLLVLWEACIVGGKRPEKGGLIERRVVTEDGDEALRLKPLELKLEKRRNVLCQGELDSIEAGELQPGRYRLEVNVVPGKRGEALAASEVAFVVK